MIPIAKPSISWREFLNVGKVLRSGNLAQGKEVRLFEDQFSDEVEGLSCVAVNSGTSALLLSLIAAGVSRGDEVIVPSFSFAATANSVVLAGATPIFVDIDLKTFNICPRSVELAITSKTKAIQPVHLYGLPANMPELQRIASKYGLIILEDAAQAHLASIDSKRVGTFGIAASFSFYPTKNMTSGEGGMIVTPSQEIYRTCRLLRNQGMEKRYENEIVGFNLRMTDLHAAIGRVQLQKLFKLTKLRQANAKFFDENLRGVITPNVPSGYNHVYHQYTILVEGHSRDAFAQELEKLGVSTGVYYPRPIHRLSAFNQTVDLPNTEIASQRVLSLPVHPKLRDRDLEKIVYAVNKTANSGA